VSRGQCAKIQRVQVIAHRATRRARAARCETQKLETAITRARMSCSARSEFSASESEDSEKDPFEVSGKEFVILPVELSETDADASPSSQYRMEMAGRQTGGRSFHEEEENNDDEEEDIDDDEEEKSDAPLRHSKSYATADIFSKFLNMTRHFTEFLEDTRKQQLSSQIFFFRCCALVISQGAIYASAQVCSCANRAHSDGG
jgi:hypothetical protein